jgi:D-glycero-D-manno-heptose 1,7-bisphosphate phosphatase
VKRAVFLDRDGVINRAVVRDGKPYPPASIEDFELLPGVDNAMRALRRAGLLVIVATNQPDVGSGLQRKDVVEAMHNRLLAADLCDDIRVCYHTAEDRCECRKPKPGMLMDAARAWNIDLSRSFLIGDRWRDVDAAKAAGCYAFFIDYGYREHLRAQPDAVIESLAQASEHILQCLSAKEDTK